MTNTSTLIVPRPIRVAAYIDGFNLYFGLKDGRLKRFYWLDMHQLAGNLLRPGQQLVVTKYFTSRISGPAAGAMGRGAIERANSRRRQSVFLDALATTPLQIFFGHFLDKGGHCNACGATWPTFEEKMTDVNIATELLADAFTDGFDTAIIISADSDLVPPVRTIRQHFPNKKIIAAFPPNRASKELRQACHAAFTIGEANLSKSQMPAQVTAASGFIIHRPAEWK